MMHRKPLDTIVQPHLLDMEPYQGVEPPEVMAARYGISPERVAKLDANENLYGASPRLPAALASSSYSIYPDPEQRRVRAAIAAYAGARPEEVIAGAGCDELIDLLVRLTVGHGDEVIDMPPTFGMYSVAVRVQGGRVVRVPRDELFDPDIADVRGAVNGRTKLIFLCNPNNPTGNLSPEWAIRELAELGPLLVVDETYHEFSGFTAAPLVAEHPNLVVLRSFSKWAGLAGLRLGYGIMAPELVQRLMAIKQPYNISTATEAALYASLEDTDLLLQRVRKLVEERVRLETMLHKMPGIQVFPSKGNFLLCRVARRPARQVQEALARQGLFVRYFSAPPIEDCLRITAGFPEHTDRLVAALQQILRS
jgi:histidinol-phosphate aminotransferase